MSADLPLQTTQRKATCWHNQIATRSSVIVGAVRRVGISSQRPLLESRKFYMSLQFDVRGQRCRSDPALSNI